MHMVRNNRINYEYDSLSMSGDTDDFYEYIVVGILPA